MLIKINSDSSATGLPINLTRSLLMPIKPTWAKVLFTMPNQGKRLSALPSTPTRLRSKIPAIRAIGEVFPEFYPELPDEFTFRFFAELLRERRPDLYTAAFAGHPFKSGSFGSVFSQISHVLDDHPHLVRRLEKQKKVKNDAGTWVLTTVFVKVHGR